MCCLWTATRGTTVAQLMHSMRQAAPGSLRFIERGRFFDKRISARKAIGFMALSRSVARRSGREHSQFRRRIHATRARIAARGTPWFERTLYQGRGPESDAEFQSPRHDSRRINGEGTRGKETGGAVRG